MHIIDEDVPILLSLGDMDLMDIFYKNIESKFRHQENGKIATVTCFYEISFLHLHPLMECPFTEAELRRLHRRFGHPKTDKFSNLPNRSELSKFTNETCDRLEKINRRCKLCLEQAPAPRRFKLTLGDNKEFNHTIFVDMFYSKKKLILHVVDESKLYQAAKW